MQIIDSFLNKITMYRLVLYYLAVLLGIAFILSFFGLLPFTPVELLVSVVTIVLISWGANTLFGFVFNAPTNVESTFITALILALIITPQTFAHYSLFLPFLVWVSIIAMASKFIFAIGNKHVFNPAAVAVVITAFAINQFASWWIGSASMLPFVLIGGFLIVRKIRRFDMAFSFFIVALLTITISGLMSNQSIGSIMDQALLGSPLFFFAFIMITEPLTTPPTRWLRASYGALVGFLFAPAIHLGSIYSTPELALLVGNLYSYAISPKQKLILLLDRKEKVTPTIYDFVFKADKPFNFEPGQYLEWTLGHFRPDSRGNRRYFTIASSPTENEIHLGVKFYEPASSFKKALAFMSNGNELVASQLAGDFVMPRDPSKKLVFIAGGIGVTPFRSMVKYLSDKGEKRDIVLLYSNRTADEIAFKEIFDEAGQKFGMKTVYAVTNADENLPAWCCGGMINAKMIMESVPDYKERMFYISGPKVMIDAFTITLQGLGVARNKIKTDFFPGFV